MRSFSTHLSLFLLSLFFLSCQPRAVSQPQSPTSSLPSVTEEEPQDPASSLPSVTEKEIRGCSSDEDCVVSCRSIDNCCGQLCQCSNVYNREFLEKLTAQQQESCEPRNCPVASCASPTTRNEGVCTEGLCTIKTVPLP